MRILELLHESDGQEKQELQAEIDAARTTIQRNLDALLEQGWITNDQRTYAITPLGEAVFSEVATATETVYIVDEFGPFLRRFPKTELGFDIETLTEASITVSSAHSPYAPLNKYIDVLQDADRFRCLLSTVGLQSLVPARNCIVRQGQPHEAVFSADLARTLRTESEYANQLEKLLEAEHYDAFVADTEISYYLGIADDCVQIGVEDDGILQAIVETNAEEIREWAEQTFQSYRTRAEPLSVTEDRPLGTRPDTSVLQE